MAVTLVYETHSITVDNETGIATGWLPGELSARGRDLAVELGARRTAVDVVYASDLGRAVETAEMAGFLRDVMDEWHGGLVLVVSHSANRWALGAAESAGWDSVGGVG
ncbi:phosphoglycerate mutase family protein [Nonomuraea angiospora]|uniref:phosphoglycerate mutase family protein n=1 Tax=Nonomuraea angiospora TaxID=46172 RepID=UPI0033F5FF75